MTEIKIGTYGWSAIIASDFTVNNIKRAALGTAEWMKENGLKKVLIGYDTRFGGKMFSRKVAKIMAAYDYEVSVSEKPISTPMLANGIILEKVDIGIYITGGSKPHFYSGYKLISKDADYLDHNIEEYIPEQPDIETDSVKAYKTQGKIKVVDVETLYIQRLLARFNIQQIRDAGLRIVVDCMHGATASVVDSILPESLQLRPNITPSFNEIVPEPNPANLSLMSQLVATTDYTCLGIGLGGAGEKSMICDEVGRFIDLEAVKAKIPSIAKVEDGIWAVFTLLEEMAATGKKLSEF